MRRDSDPTEDGIRINARSAGRSRLRPDDLLSLKHEHLKSADFSDRKLKVFSAVDCRFESCRFDGMRIESAAFGAGREPSNYIGCSFNGARIDMGPGGYARFVECSFQNVKLKDWLCFTVELVDCIFSGTIEGAVFNGTVPEDDRVNLRRSHNEIRNNDFSDVALIDVAFRTGVDLTQQKLPSGPEYLFIHDAPRSIAETRREIVHWDDLEARREALNFIKSLEYELTGGQNQLLLRIDEFKPMSARVADDVFSLVRSTDRNSNG